MCRDRDQAFGAWFAADLCVKFIRLRLDGREACRKFQSLAPRVFNDRKNVERCSLLNKCPGVLLISHKNNSTSDWKKVKRRQRERRGRSDRQRGSRLSTGALLNARETGAS